MSVSNTFHAWLFNLHAVTLQPLNGAVTDPLILWTSVNFQALRRRRATQRFSSEDTALALSSVQDIPFSTSSAIYSAQA